MATQAATCSIATALSAGPPKAIPAVIFITQLAGRDWIEDYLVPQETTR